MPLIYFPALVSWLSIVTTLIQTFIIFYLKLPDNLLIGALIFLDGNIEREILDSKVVDDPSISTGAELHSPYIAIKILHNSFLPF